MNTTKPFLGIFNDAPATEPVPSPPLAPPAIDQEALAARTSELVLKNLEKRAAEEEEAEQEAKAVAEAEEASRKGDHSLEIARLREQQAESERKTAELSAQLEATRLEAYRTSAIASAQAKGFQLLEELVAYGPTFQDIEASVHASINRYKELETGIAARLGKTAAAPADGTPQGTTTTAGGAINPGGTVPTAVSGSAPPEVPNILSPERLAELTANPALYMKHRDEIQAALRQQSGKGQAGSMAHPTFGTVPGARHPSAFDPSTVAAKPQLKTPADMAREAIARTRGAVLFPVNDIEEIPCLVQ